MTPDGPSGAASHDVRDVLMPLVCPLLTAVLSQLFRHTGPRQPHEPCPVCLALYVLMALQLALSVWITARRRSRRVLFALIFLVELVIGGLVTFAAHMGVTGLWV